MDTFPLEGLGKGREGEAHLLPRPLETMIGYGTVEGVGDEPTASATQQPADGLDVSGHFTRGVGGAVRHIPPDLGNGLEEEEGTLDEIGPLERRSRAPCAVEQAHLSGTQSFATEMFHDLDARGPVRAGQRYQVLHGGVRANAAGVDAGLHFHGQALQQGQAAAHPALGALQLPSELLLPKSMFPDEFAQKARIFESRPWSLLLQAVAVQQGVGFGHRQEQRTYRVLAEQP
jgi:hypothetical protein